MSKLRNFILLLKIGFITILACIILSKLKSRSKTTAGALISPTDRNTQCNKMYCTVSI